MTPVIEHLVDEITADDGSVEQVYNYLVYHWPNPRVVARAYLHEPHTVAITTGDPNPEIMAYLRGRYARIQRLGRDGYQLVEE